MTSKTAAKKQRKYYKDPDFLLKVGARIQQLMHAKGITHEIFYHDTSINPHRLISAQKNMTLSTFARICDYLQVSPEEFFRGIR